MKFQLIKGDIANLGWILPGRRMQRAQDEFKRPSFVVRLVQQL
jgi:hypothetical protein